jgi:hypothetical protein
MLQGKDVLEWNSVELTRVRALETLDLDDKKVGCSLPSGLALVRPWSSSSSL